MTEIGLSIGIDSTMPAATNYQHGTVVYSSLEEPISVCHIFAWAVNYVLSLSTVVLNSRDRHEKTWRPTFLRLHNMPHNMLYLKKMTEIHWYHYNNTVPS